MNILEVENDYVIFYYYFKLQKYVITPEPFPFCGSTMKGGGVVKMGVRNGTPKSTVKPSGMKSNNLDQG